MSCLLYYASDIHGSEVVWRKFINAGKFYRADVLIMGGDITGKAIVPIVDVGDGFVAEEFTGDRVLDNTEVVSVEAAVRDKGFYPYRMTREEVSEVYTNQAKVDALFQKVMRESLVRWLELAEDRLANTGIKLFVMLGNDDEEALRDVISESSTAVDPENQVVEIGDGFEMYSCGWTNPSPWHTAREMPDDQFEEYLEGQISGLEDPEHAIFNFHAPPYGTCLDRAPLLDETLAPIVSGGQIQIDSVGSRAVRAMIEKFQPALGLHGHIHEARGMARLGRTLCINSGSEYTAGTLHGALVTLDGKKRGKGIRQYVLTAG